MRSKLGNLSIREILVVMSAYVCPPPVQTLGEGEGSPKTTQWGVESAIFSCLSRNRAVSFVQPAFFLAGNRVTTVAFEKEVFLKSLACLAKQFIRQKRRLGIEKKFQISINGKKRIKRILSCLFGGRQKVQVKKFAFEEFIFVARCCCKLGRHNA